MPTSDKLKITELEFDEIKTNLVNYLKGQNEFQDYDFEGSSMSVLIDLLAYNTHYMGYYANMLGNEMFLDSSSLRESVVSHAKMLNVHPTSRRSAKAKLNILFTPDDNPTSLTIEKDTRFTSTIDGISYTFTTNKATSIKPTATGLYLATGLEICEGSILRKAYTVNGSDTSQRFIIPNPNVDTSTLSVTIQKSSSDSEVTFFRDGNALDVTTITNKDNVYYIQEVEGRKYEITFGDNVIGKSLEDGNIIFIEYMISSGISGNLASTFKAIGNVAGFDSSKYQIATTEVATGGADYQSIESLQYQAPKLYQAQGRATTKNDYQAIILQERPDVESITVYGGEDADTVQYGRVFIAVKIAGTNVLSKGTKDSIQNSILKNVNVVTVEPIIIDPIFFYLYIESTVNYDPVTNLTDEDTLKTNINTSITEYLDINLQKFNSKFRYSQMVQIIDNTDNSIRNNKTNLKYQQRITPSLNIPQTFILYFNNKIEKGTVSSSSFTFQDGNVYSLVDDSNGNIKSARTTNDIVDIPYEYFPQSDGSSNQGTIDYDTGKITLNSLTILSADSTGLIRINVQPDINNSDITPLREQIITYDSEDTTSIIINMVAETII
jgi:hypothetical protein